MSQIISNNRSGTTSWLPIHANQNESPTNNPPPPPPPDNASSTDVAAGTSMPVPAPVAMPQGIPVNAAILATTSTVVPLNDAYSTTSSNNLDNSSSNTAALANTKEKTPMCLVNELARFNQLTPQYTLTDEQGPAHSKQFFVLLTLGSEKYAASGASIKKAQHAAANRALAATVYTHPPIKIPRQNAAPTTSNITPTMQLNALAMKLGQSTHYIPLEAPQRPYFTPPNLNFRGMYNQRYHYPCVQRVFYVVLRVGEREFTGEGATRQAARHSAAAKALHVLSSLSPAMPSSEATAETGVVVQNGNVAEDGVDNSIKSEISLVHEIALKRKFSVDFQVQHESGPPHLRHFVIMCVCGEMTATGEGGSKKQAKKRAAEQMLVQLRDLPPLPYREETTEVGERVRARGPGGRPKKMMVKKKKNSIKKVEPEYGTGINPISRLIQIQQAKRCREPIYRLVNESGTSKQKEFVIEVAVDSETCQGHGRSKRLAKRVAAELMLQRLGYSQLAPAPAKPAIKTEGGSSGGNSGVGGASGPGGDKKVTFSDQDFNNGRQPLPGGVIVMPEGTLNPPTTTAPGAYPTASGLNRAPGTPPLMSADNGTVGPLTEPRFTLTTISAVAQEMLANGFSPTAEVITKVDGTPTPDLTDATPKQQLLYVAEVLQIAVQFTDLPKLQGSTKNEFMSLVSLSTNPAQVSHGSGPTSAVSHNMAAHTALRALAELSARVATKVAIPPVSGASDKGTDTLGAGDGPHVQTMVSSDKRAGSEVTTT